jgi:hypothetical protein
MRGNVGAGAALLSLAVVSLCGVASAKHAQVPVMRLFASTEVMAPPSAVWSEITTGKNLVTWCPEWKSTRNASVNLTKVGDVLDYSDEFGNGGSSIVTYLVKDKELRVAHEPNKGDYMCQAKLILAPTATGTRVEYWEQYTDESSPRDMDATALKMETSMAQNMAALKKGCETTKK